MKPSFSAKIASPMHHQLWTKLFPQNPALKVCCPKVVAQEFARQAFWAFLALVHAYILKYDIGGHYEQTPWHECGPYKVSPFKLCGIRMKNIYGVGSKMKHQKLSNFANQN